MTQPKVSNLKLCRAAPVYEQLTEVNQNQLSVHRTIVVNMSRFILSPVGSMLALVTSRVDETM